MEVSKSLFQVRNNIFKLKNQFSLAKDLFSKLCSYPPSERYDAKMAL
jgi:hypothetical protein